MGSTKFTRRDINRFRKVYPYTPRRKVLRAVAEESFIIEEGTITFTSANSGSYVFLEKYLSVPNVVITAFDSAGNDEVGVVLNITAITTSSVTIESTASFTGTVNVQVMQIGE